MKNNLFADIITELDSDIIENYYEMDEKYAKNISFRLNYNHLAVAACAVLVFGAALNVPKFISPGINDPSVPPVVSTEGEETPIAAGTNKETAENTDAPIVANTNSPTVENTKAPTTENTTPEESRPPAPTIAMQGCFAYKCEKEYDLNDEFIEITIYYGLEYFYLDGATFPYNRKDEADVLILYSMDGTWMYNRNDDGPDMKCHLMKTIPRKEFADQKHNLIINKDDKTIYASCETIRIPTFMFKEAYDDHIDVAIAFDYFYLVYTGDKSITTDTLENLNYPYKKLPYGGAVSVGFSLTDDKIIMDQTEWIIDRYKDYQVFNKIDYVGTEGQTEGNIPWYKPWKREE